MNASPPNSKNSAITPASKLFNLPRPVIGALVVFFIYSFSFLLFRRLDSFASFIIEAPALWVSPFLEAIYLLPISNSSADFLANVTAYLVSSIPPILIGSIIFSKNRIIRWLGILLCVLYFIATICTWLAMLILIGSG